MQINFNEPSTQRNAVTVIGMAISIAAILYGVPQEKIALIMSLFGLGHGLMGVGTPDK